MRSKTNYTTAKILVFDDNKDVREAIRDLIIKDGYIIYEADDASHCLEIVDEVHPDLVLLDYHLPFTKGDKIIPDIKRISKGTKIIMISASVYETKLLESVEHGADDHITKPFDLKSLTTKVEARLRDKFETDRLLKAIEANQSKQENILLLNCEDHSISMYSEKIFLPFKQFQAASILIKNTGRVVLRETFLTELSEGDKPCTYESLLTLIKRLRKSLNNILPGEDVVITRFNMGYMWDSRFPVKIFE